MLLVIWLILNCVAFQAQKYKPSVDDLFQRNAKLGYENFESYMLHILQREYESNKKQCYGVVWALANNENLKKKHAQSFARFFYILIRNKFADETVSALF